jgi:hypothetical protein
MSERSKPVVYVMSPYTKGDQAINTHFQMSVFNELLDDGIVTPIIPLTSHFLHIFHPRKYQDWINYDLELIDVCHAGLRLNAEHENMNYLIKESSGADGEEARFSVQGKPVFYNKADLYRWHFSLDDMEVLE